MSLSCMVMGSTVPSRGSPSLFLFFFFLIPNDLVFGSIGSRLFMNYPPPVSRGSVPLLRANNQPRPALILLNTHRIASSTWYTPNKRRRGITGIITRKAVKMKACSHISEETRSIKANTAIKDPSMLKLRGRRQRQRRKEPSNISHT